MFKKEMVVETTLEHGNNLEVQALASIYTVSTVHINARNDDQVIVRFIIKKSKIKDFKANLRLLNGLGIKGRIVE
jgi:hypothetical protein